MDYFSNILEEYSIHVNSSGSDFVDEQLTKDGEAGIAVKLEAEVTLDDKCCCWDNT